MIAAERAGCLTLESSMHRSSIPVLLVAALALSACQSGPRQSIGAVTGAVAGGIIGNQVGQGQGRVLATVAGAAIGALVGSEIGRALDEQDRQRAYAAQYSALEQGRPGVPVAWQNPQSGKYGQVVPGPVYSVNQSTCREYTHTIYIDGRPEVLRGTACRQPDGTWRDVG